MAFVGFRCVHLLNIGILLPRIFEHPRTRYGPVEVGDGVKVVSTRHLRAVHVPYAVLAAHGVPPEDVGPAVTVEVGGGGYYPAAAGLGGKT